MQFGVTQFGTTEFGAEASGLIVLTPAAGVASAEAFGNATIAASIILSPPSIASGEAFGSPAIAATIAVEPGGIATAEAFGAATIAAAITISPASIASEESFGTPAVATVGAIVLSPASIGSAEAFGTPSLTTDQVVAPGSIASGEALGQPDVEHVLPLSGGGAAAIVLLLPPESIAGVTASVRGIPSAEAVGRPAIAQTPAPVAESLPPEATRPAFGRAAGPAPDVPRFTGLPQEPIERREEPVRRVTPTIEGSIEIETSGERKRDRVECTGFYHNIELIEAEDEELLLMLR